MWFFQEKLLASLGFLSLNHLKFLAIFLLCMKNPVSQTNFPIYISWHVDSSSLNVLSFSLLKKRALRVSVHRPLLHIYSTVFLVFVKAYGNEKNGSKTLNEVKETWCWEILLFEQGSKSLALIRISSITYSSVPCLYQVSIFNLGHTENGNDMKRKY